MEEETIKRLSDAKGMKNPELFIKFFMARFPNESNTIESYCNEWIDRFLSGNPVAYMDFESILVYLHVITDILEHDLKVKTLSKAIKKAQEELKEREAKNL